MLPEKRRSESPPPSPLPQTSLRATTVPPTTHRRRIRDVSGNHRVPHHADSQAPQIPAFNNPGNATGSYMAVVVVSVGVAVCIGLVVYLARAGISLYLSQSGMCRTSDCRAHAETLLGSMDRSKDPCTDFHGYVCSNWRPKNRYGSFEASALQGVMTTWFKSLEGILRMGAQHIEAGRKPLNMLQACTSQKTWNPSDLRDFRNLLAKLRLSWPEPPPKNVSALGVLLDLIYNWKLCFWFQIRVLRNFTGSSTHRILLTPGSKVDLYLFAFNHHNLVANGSYSQHWADHERLLVNNGSVAQNIALAKKIAHEEREIIGTLLRAANKQVITPMIIPLSGLGNYTEAVDSTEWIRQINNTVNVGDSFTPSDEVLVSDPSLLESIGCLFDTFGDQELIYHLSWQFVQTYAHIIDRNLLHGRDMSVAETICQRHVQMAYNPLIVTMYVRLHPPEWRHTRLRANFELIMRQASKTVNGSSWLDDKSKETAMAKLNEMMVQTWPNDELVRDMAKIYSTFPDGGREAGNSSFVRLWIKTRESLRALAATPFHDLISRFRPVPLPILVAYDYFTNEVDVAVAALERPVYYENGTFAMFYGGIGFLFALEVMKIQDALGVRLHPNGTVVSSWITRDSRLQFQDQKRCFGEASNSSSHQLLPTAVPALEVTYAAFSSAVAHSNQSLQLSRELTEPKVFFMTLCLMLCGTDSSKGDVVDCNLLLRNSHSFPDAFQCAPGTPMNPAKKCKYFDN